MNQAIELEEMQRLIATEKRLSVASANRENQLSEKSSSAKARLLSPQETPSSNDGLDARIEQANSRRELYLTQKVEKAKKYRSSPINKELFAAASPKQDSEDGFVGTQDNVEVCFYGDISFVEIRGDQKHSESHVSLTKHTIDVSDEEGKNIHHGLSMPLVAISGVAVVLVALLSLLKTR